MESTEPLMKAAMPGVDVLHVNGAPDRIARETLKSYGHSSLQPIQKIPTGFGHSANKNGLWGATRACRSDHLYGNAN